MKLTLATKINFIFISILLILAIIIGFVSYNQMVISIKSFATEKAKGDLNIGYRYLDQHYPGDWYIKDDKLYKGDVLLNDNYEIVDTIGEDTGDTVTIFQNNVRITTNVMVDGERAVGTLLSDEVADVVLNKGENFYGEAEVAGHIYQTAYKPIKNREGDIIGVFYVGAPQNVINETVSAYVKKFVAVFAIVIAVSIIAIFIFTTRIKRRLARTSNAMKLAGEGDFTVEISDQVGDELTELVNSYNSMKKNLQEIIANVQENSNQVATSSQELNDISENSIQSTEQITQTIQMVADGAEKQTNKIEESSKYMENLNFGIQQINKNSSSASSFSYETLEKAKQGGILVNSTVEQIEKINESVKKCGDSIKQLEIKSDEINDITKAITNIASETNMLALNAAIEAARAGEAGKGFSVVADEVGRLAIQSQNSSQQISDLIEEVKTDIYQSTVAIEQVMSEVQQGLEIVEKTDDSFKEITYSIENIKQIIEDMTSVCTKISNDASIVANSIQEVAVVSKDTSSQTQMIVATTEEQLAATEEISASANSLANMAAKLQEVISKFKI